MLSLMFILFVLVQSELFQIPNKEDFLKSIKRSNNGWYSWFCLCVSPKYDDKYLKSPDDMKIVLSKLPKLNNVCKNSCKSYIPYAARFACNNECNGLIPTIYGCPDIYNIYTSPTNILYYKCVSGSIIDSLDVPDKPNKRLKSFIKGEEPLLGMYYDEFVN